MIYEISIPNKTSLKVEIPEQGSIGVYVSGGVDSALLTYFLVRAKTEHNLDTRIFPLTAERLGRPFNMRHAQRVLEKIKYLTKAQFDLHLCHIIPNHQESFQYQDECRINGFYAKEFTERFNIQSVYAAHSMPINEYSRDDVAFEPGDSTNLNIVKPFSNLNKRDIASVYDQENLISTLLPATRSCEADMIESNHFRKVCRDIGSRSKECSQCLERSLAFADYI